MTVSKTVWELLEAANDSVDMKGEEGELERKRMENCSNVVSSGHFYLVRRHSRALTSVMQYPQGLTAKNTAQAKAMRKTGEADYRDQVDRTRE
jgi:hypothetical protein